MPYRLDIPGWMLETELDHIEQLAKHVPEHGEMIEVGSFCGRSTWAWANSIPKTATIHCIDVWNGFEVNEEQRQSMSGVLPDGPLSATVPAFHSYTRDCKNIKMIQMDSDDALDTLADKQYDLIFLDGGHTNPVMHRDIQLSFPMVKPGGILCGHDFDTAWPDVMQEVSDLAKSYGLTISFARCSSIWVVRVPMEEQNG